MSLRINVHAAGLKKIKKYMDLWHQFCAVCCCCVCSQGKISFKNLKRVAKELGENLTDEELQVR